MKVLKFLLLVILSLFVVPKNQNKEKEKNEIKVNLVRKI
jgi:hypothetical protein